MEFSGEVVMLFVCFISEDSSGYIYIGFAMAHYLQLKHMCVAITRVASNFGETWRDHSTDPVLTW